MNDIQHGILCWHTANRSRTETSSFCRRPQNFEVFEEDPNSSRGGRSTRRADPHFIGYTFKNWEVTAAVRGAASEPGARELHRRSVKKLVWDHGVALQQPSQVSFVLFEMFAEKLEGAESHSCKPEK